MGRGGAGFCLVFCVVAFRLGMLVARGVICSTWCFECLVCKPCVACTLYLLVIMWLCSTLVHWFLLFAFCFCLW